MQQICIKFSELEQAAWGSTKESNRVLTALQCNIHSAPPKVKECAYQTFKRPITEYAGPAWNPHTSKGVATVESVQRWAARFVCNNYQRSKSVLSIKLNWSSLEEWRMLIDLSLFYKFQYNCTWPEEPTILISRLLLHMRRMYIARTCLDFHLNEWNAQNALWSCALRPSVTHNLVTCVLTICHM